jgi:ribonuclease HI
VVACWYLWWIRRRITHNESIPPTVCWSISVLAIASNYHKALTKTSRPLEQKWVKPDPRFVKVNVDVAYYEDEGMGATSAVLRDEKGNFIAATCKFIPFAADVVTTEAMAMRDGLVLANSLGFNRLEVESDSMQVINFCTGQSRWWDAATAIFAERVDTSTLIGKVIYKHCYRSSNQAGHVLANYSYCSKLSLVWMNEPPGMLVSKLVDNVSIN